MNLASFADADALRPHPLWKNRAENGVEDMSQQDCIFCKIIAGEIPCARIYETERILSFLDIAPTNKGHALVIPKHHHATLFDLPSEMGRDLIRAMRKVARAVMDTTGAEGFNVGMNNFEVAGQLVPHVHFHVIPRFRDDGLVLWGQKSYDDNDEMMQLAKEIAGRIHP